MKKIKKLLVFILIAVSLLALASCDDKPQPKQLADVLPELDENQMAVIICNGEGDYDVYIFNPAAQIKTVEDVLAALKRSGRLNLDWTDSTYGKYINSIGKLTPDASKNEYIEVFTSNPDYQGTWAGVTTIEAGDVTLKSASVGVSELKVAAGDVIYFELATY